MKVAIYCRTSRVDQNPENQLIDLERYAKGMGWEYEVFQEQESTRKTRPIKDKVFRATCQKRFDRVLVWKLDRWARSLQELINDLNMLKQNNAQFQSFKDNIILDDNPSNMLMIHILGAFAEFERAIIRQRTMAGLARAKARGKKLGRPKGSTKGNVPTEQAVSMLMEQDKSHREISKILGCSRYMAEITMKRIREKNMAAETGGVNLENQVV